MLKSYNDFTKLYSLQKTLRFELKPIGKTLEHIKKSEIIESDETLEEQYAIVKNIIDRFHRKHIDEALSLVDFTKHLDTFKTIQELYLKRGKTDREKKELEELSADLRKLIVSYLKGNVKQKTQHNLNPIKERFEILFGKELFTNEEFFTLAENKEEKKAIQAFKGFTTYFKGFQENRKNMYSEEDKSTAIAYRIINENLPLFIENIARFQKVMSTIDKTTIKKLEQNLKAELKGHSVSDIFRIEYFNNVLTQEGITRYNTIIGGKTTQEGVKIQGLNEIINLYNQQSKDVKLPILKPLHKQILSEEYSTSFKIKAFENDNEVLKAIDTFWNEHIEKSIHPVTGKRFNILLKIENLCKKLEKYKDKELEKLFIERKNLSTVSHQVYGQWNIIRDALRMHLEMNNKNIKEKDIDKYLDNDAFAWKEIKDSIKIYKEHVEDAKELDENGIVKYFSSMSINEEDDEKEYSISLIKNINEKYNNVKSILEEDRTGKSDLHQDKEKVAIIKEFLDSLKQLQWFLKLLYVTVPLDEKDYEFYNELEVYYEALLPLNSLYNKVRNYMTRKPYSVEKFKLNFYSPTLLDGWDKNKETANLSIILKKNGKYYLGIMNKENNTIFENFPKSKSNDYYEKMIYKLLPGPNKMLPKVFFSKKGLEYYKPSKEILRIYEKGKFKKDKSGNFKKESLHTLIDFYKEAIAKNEDWKIFTRFNN
jgi:CRISPR-associated protein Cpf1